MITKSKVMLEKDRVGLR